MCVGFVNVVRSRSAGLLAALSAAAPDRRSDVTGGQSGFQPRGVAVREALRWADEQRVINA